jgi:hypothetical protein
MDRTIISDVVSEVFMTLNMLEASSKRLFPNRQPEQVMAELLLEKAQKNLIKYQSMARQFQEKYALPFDDFRQKMLNAELNANAEQDYFDWELAVTGMEDMRDEIKKLKALSK